MTPEQKRTLDYIESYWSANGVAPSLREIAAARGLTSLNNVHAQVAQLIAQGYLVRTDARCRNVAPAALWLRQASTEQLRAELARREAGNG